MSQQDAQASPRDLVTARGMHVSNTDVGSSGQRRREKQQITHIPSASIPTGILKDVHSLNGSRKIFQNVRPTSTFSFISSIPARSCTAVSNQGHQGHLSSTYAKIMITAHVKVTETGVKKTFTWVNPSQLQRLCDDECIPNDIWGLEKAIWTASKFN